MSPRGIFNKTHLSSLLRLELLASHRSLADIDHGNQHLQVLVPVINMKDGRDMR